MFQGSIAVSSPFNPQKPLIFIINVYANLNIPDLWPNKYKNFNLATNFKFYQNWLII